jgi:hypothetical protein
MTEPLPETSHRIRGGPEVIAHRGASGILDFSLGWNAHSRVPSGTHPMRAQVRAPDTVARRRPATMMACAGDGVTWRQESGTRERQCTPIWAATSWLVEPSYLEET